MTLKHNISFSHTWRGWFSKNSTRLVGIWSCLATLLLLFIALAEDVAEREPIRFDTPILLWLHSHATPLFDSLMLRFTWLGGTPLLLIGCAILVVLLWRGRSQAATFWAFALVGAAVLNLSGKLMFQRARPDLWSSISPEYDYGFPSGHSMMSSAFTMALFLLVWRSQIPAFVKWTVTCLGVFFVLGVGLSRLYLGVHYPSDVIAGWALSAAWVMLLQKSL